MNSFKIEFILLTAFCLVSLLPFSAAWSADEDMISQVYLEFDPETGEFVTAQDPNLTGKSKHAAGQSQQIEQIQQAQDQLASGQGTDAQTPVAAAPPPQQAPMASDDMNSSGSTTLIAVVIGVVLLVGIVAWVRKSQHSA